MKKVYLNRILSSEKQTLGICIFVKDEQTAELFIAKTLELPLKNNAPNISCIPAGKYVCKWTRSNRLSLGAGEDVFTYEVQNVPGRSGIRIHSANFFFQLAGCLAMGAGHKNINADAELDIIHSGVTVGAFNDLMNREDFELIIT